MEPLILKHKKWNTLLNDLQAGKKFTMPINNKRMVNILAPTATLAFALSQYRPLSDDKVLRICIAGAGQFDADNNGNHYKLLPEMIGVDNIHIDLVGLDLHKDKRNHPYVLKQAVGTSVTTHLIASSIQDYMDTNEMPDVVMLNHPGFEMYGGGWFDEAQWLNNCIDAGVSVLGCSYGLDESEFDTYFARAYGYSLSAPKVNPFHISISTTIPRSEALNMSGGKSILNGAMDWGRHVWKIEGRNARGRDNELLEILDKGTNVKGHMIEQTGNPDFFVDGFNTKTVDGKQNVVLLHLNPALYYVVGADVITNEDGEVLLDEIELDRSYLNRDLFTYFQGTLITGIIYNDYEDELKWILSQGDDLDEHDHDEDEIAKMMKLFMGEGNRTMTKAESKINELISSSDWTKLAEIDSDSLRLWQNEERQTLFHISAKLGSLALYELAKDVNVDILARDGDGFSLLDICAENNQVDVLRQAVKDYDLDLDAADMKGFTAMHRAYMYNSLNAAEALEQLGANPNPVNLFGVSAKDLGNLKGTRAPGFI
jgi:hypothetical protein